MGFLKRLFGGLPSEHEFAAMVASSLRDIGAPEPIEYVEDEFTLVTGDLRQVFLGNMYRDYCDAPKANRQSMFERYVRAHLDQLPRTLAEAEPHLLPSVRHRVTLEAMKLQAELMPEATFDAPFVLLAEHLSQAAAYDTEHSTATVSADVLKGWGLSFDEAMEIALRNLRSRSTEPWVEMGGGIFASPWGDSYDASRLLLHDVVHRAGVAGDPVAFLPNRNLVLLTGSANEAGVATTMALAMKGATEDRPISVIPVVLRDGTWTPFETDHEGLRGVLAAGRVEELAGVYDQQRPLLERLVGEEAFVAAYSVVRTDEGEPFSHSTWTEGVPSMLPYTDRVALVPRGPGGIRRDAATMVSWQSLGEMAGHHLEDVGCWPPRVRTNGFPSPDEIALMERFDRPHPG